MVDLPTVNRRTALKGIGGLAAASLAGAVGLRYASGPTTAAFAPIDSLTVSTDDGDLSFVDVHVPDYYAIWDGFDVPVAAVAFRDVLEELDGAGGVANTHVLYDQNGVDAQPVLLANISSEGDGSDGWGGPGEYASTFDSATTPDTGVVNRPGVDGPAQATAGWVHANVDWRLLSDDLSAHPALSIETPAVIGTDVSELDNPADGSTEAHDFRVRKQVHFYTDADNGAGTPLRNDADTADLWLMGVDDGTRQLVEATPGFTVEVQNEADAATPEGSATLSGG